MPRTNPKAIFIPGNSQRSEDTVGPYELQDFFLYNVLRHGYRPSKVAWLARHAWGEAAFRAGGTWGDFRDWVSR